MSKFSDFFEKAFAYKNTDEKFTEDEIALMDKLAKKIVEMRLTTPAIFALETSKPLNFVGSQALAFFEPMVKSFFDWKDYERIRTILERRNSVSTIIEKIEHYNNQPEAGPDGRKDGE